MMIHTGETLNKCVICGNFCQQSDPNKHMSIHTACTGEKPYKCDICSKGFNEHRILTKHMSYTCQKRLKWFL